MSDDNFDYSRVREKRDAQEKYDANWADFNIRVVKSLPSQVDATQLTPDQLSKVRTLEYELQAEYNEAIERWKRQPWWDPIKEKTLMEQLLPQLEQSIEYQRRNRMRLILDGDKR